MSVKMCAQPGQRPAAMADTSPGTAGARLFSRRICHYGDRSTLQGRVNVAIPGGGFAFHRHENKASRDLPRIVVQAADRRLKTGGVAALRVNLNASQQITKGHGWIISRELAVPCRHFLLASELHDDVTARRNSGA